jgi:glycosyltransferase involved in cell wall biosynthesis
VAAEPRRVVVVQTHPVQYMAPWFRHIAADAPDLALTVLYGAEPTARTQGAGFDTPFTWQLPLREGYAHRVLASEPYDGDLDAAGFSDLDALNLEDALTALDPHAVVVPGWHAALYRRALDICRRRGWPVLYRGDSTHQSGRTRVPRWLRRVVTRRRLRRFDAWLAVGTRSREYLLDHGVVEPLVFHSPHAVDVEWFAERAPARRAGREQLARAFGLDPSLATVLFVGKLQDKKRPLDLMRALARTAQPMQALVAGAGPLAEACQAEARRLGVRVAFAGFLQPDALTDAYAVADLLAVPSGGDETWGLVVNEALASGLPCVVSHLVGCQPDLVDDRTGRTFPAGDVASLAGALDDVVERRRAGHDYAPACLATARRFDLATATTGLRLALDRLTRRRPAPASPAPRRLIACCGGMSTPGGAERMTFEILRLAREHGAEVHCIVNTWGSSQLVDMADGIGASWSTGYYWYRMERRVWHPVVAARLMWDVLCTSAGLLRDAWRMRAATVLVPDFTTVLRNWPALMLLRAADVRVVLKLGNAPDPGPAYGRLWRWLIAPACDVMVCNSPFTARELAAHRVPARKVRLVPNVLPAHRAQTPPGTPMPGRLLFVGQLIPDKGAHLLIAAVSQLVAEGHDVTLDLAGAIDGWESPAWAGYHARLRQSVRDAELTDRVRFLGWQDDVPALFATAWLHLVPSLPAIREGFGIVVLEAKAAAVPSIVGPSGALPDLVEHGVDGWLVSTPTGEAFADGIRAMLPPATRAAAAAAAQRSLAHFSPDAFARGWMEACDWNDALH